jgi:hypothetical protein
MLRRRAPEHHGRPRGGRRREGRDERQETRARALWVSRVIVWLLLLSGLLFCCVWSIEVLAFC